VIVWDLDAVRNEKIYATQENQLWFKLHLHHTGDFRCYETHFLAIETLEAVEFQDDMLMPLPGAVGIGLSIKTIKLYTQMVYYIFDVTLVVVLWRKEPLGSIEISTANQKSNFVNWLAKGLSYFQNGFVETEKFLSLVAIEDWWIFE
jgi:hypothetical protein